MNLDLAPPPVVSSGPMLGVSSFMGPPNPPSGPPSGGGMMSMSGPSGGPIDTAAITASNEGALALTELDQGLPGYNQGCGHRREDIRPGCWCTEGTDNKAKTTSCERRQC